MENADHALSDQYLVGNHFPNLTVGLRRRKGIGAFNPRLFY
jgi:hypothetical protein